MNWLDILILLPIVYGLVRGIMRGVIKEILAIVGVIAGIIVARLFVRDVTTWLSSVIAWDVQLIRPIAYVLLFLATAIICALIAKLLTQLMKAISLGWANRLIGGLFGAVKWILIVGVIIYGLDLIDHATHLLKPEIKQQSIAYNMIHKYVTTPAEQELKNANIHIQQ